MDTKPNEESTQSKRLNFRNSIQKSVHEQNVTVSSVRRSTRLGQQQMSESKIVARKSEATLHSSPKKRKSNKVESESESSTTPLKKSPKRKKGYAPPETYAHLRELNDCIKMHLDVLFCGINPGVLSATVGHHFAHPSNRFYKALHGSGLTDERVDPSEDYTLPDRYNIGITDLVDRPSASADQLKRFEFRDSTPSLLQKIAKYRPRIVCFVGMGMYAEVEKVLVEMVATADIEDNLLERAKKKPLSKRELAPGLRPFKLVYSAEKGVESIEETLFFSSPSTSGLAATYQEKDLTKLYSQLRSIVCSHKDKSIDTSEMQIIPLKFPSQ